MRLLIIRNADAPLLARLDLDRKDLRIVLIQNAVYSEALRAKNAQLLEDDARARKMESANTISYDQLLDAVMSAEKVMCI